MHTSSSDIPAVILAGGCGRRMGGIDKCLLRLGEHSLLEHICARLRPQVSEILLNVNGDTARFAKHGLPLISDMFPSDLGPLAGVASALHHVRQHSPAREWLLSVAGDCPFLPGDLTAALYRHARAQRLDIAYAESAGREHYVIALWSARTLAPLLDYIAGGGRSVGGFIKAQRSGARPFESREVDPFFNINTASELEQALAILQR